MTIDVLIVGGGGREHALAWKLKQSPRLGKLYMAPGNGGTEAIAENAPIAATDIPSLVDFVLRNNIGLTVAVPDDPLAAGIVDAFEEKGLLVFGPSKAAAQIEASKEFSKKLMKKQGVPTAEFEVFTEYKVALEYVRNQTYPMFIKASGLALGKGAVRANGVKEAEKILSDMMVDKVFGEAGAIVVIESFLDGPEISLHAFCDGQNYKLFPASQDHKPIFDGGKGPNTGGMGTVAPLPGISDADIESLGKQVVVPILDGLTAAGSPYKGLLYPGLKLTKGGPKVLEYNARFGDPETQVYMRLLESDLLEIFLACTHGNLNALDMRWSGKFAVCVVLASGGYPGAYEKGLPIQGIDKAELLDNIIVYHAGTKYEDGEFKTNGGRVLNVTAIGDSIEEARSKAYEAVKLISFPGMQYRTDIGLIASQGFNKYL